MPVDRFSVPGDSTRREFAVYVVVACERYQPDFYLYVGKTGDNREGCNPVISRAGNHFSYNKIHSQIRNKLPSPPWDYDYEYFYSRFFPYEEGDQRRREKVELVNEMERRVNVALQEMLTETNKARLLNPYKGTGYINAQEKQARLRLATPDCVMEVRTLADEVLQYLHDRFPNEMEKAHRR